MSVYPANYCQSNQLEPGKNRASFRVEIKRHENSGKEADPDQPSTWEEGKAGRKWLGMVFPRGQVDLFPPGLDFPQHPSGSLEEGAGECGNHRQAESSEQPVLSGEKG